MSIKSIYGKLLDWTGLANVPAAVKALAGLKGSVGQIVEISGTDAQGVATAFQAVDKPAGDGGTVPTKVSAFENDAGYQTEAQVNALLAAFPTFEIQVVAQLPAVGEERTIYLVPFADDSGSYLEYLWVNGAWEVVGSGKDSGENVALSDAEKTLILTLFRNAAYISDDMGAVLAQLESLWSGGGEVEPNPEKTLTSISAVYSGGSVPVGTAVSALTGVVVTAHYSDGSTATVTGYTLSGSIAEGSNTITVSYGGKTTTFTVTGVAESTGGEPIDAYTAYNWTDGLYLSWDTSAQTVHETPNDSWASSDYISLDGVSKIEAAELSGKNLAKYDAFFYDDAKTALSTAGGYVRKDNATYPSPVDIAIPEGARFVRFCGQISCLSNTASNGVWLKYYIYK